MNISIYLFIYLFIFGRAEQMLSTLDSVMPDLMYVLHA